MAFKLRAVTETRAIGDDTAQRRYVYVDKATGKTLELLEPLHESDDVDRLLRREPTRQHRTTNGSIRIVTTWSREPKER